MLVNEKRLSAGLRDRGYDGLIGATIENVRYLADFSSVSLTLHPYFGQCYAVVTADRPADPFVVSSTGEIDQILDGTERIRGYRTFATFYREMGPDAVLSSEEARLQEMTGAGQGAPNGAEALADALVSLGLAEGKIGYDEDGFRKGVLDQVKARLPKATFEPATDLLAWTRRVKTPEEVSRIRQSAHVTENAIQAALSVAYEGVTERELFLEFNRSISAQGGEPKFTFIKFGRNGVGGQVVSNRTTLQKGDSIWFDVGCTWRGYWSDLARNASLGEPPARVAALYKAMKAGCDHGIDATRPGMTGADVFDLTMEASRQAGAPHYRRHHIGHSIGAEVYENPILAPGNKVEIEAGMVLNIETPYYEFGTGAVHVEDPFVVGENGDNVLLTKLDRDLIVLER